MADERVGYPTQKPEALLERIIKASSNEGDLVADSSAAPARPRPWPRNWAASGSSADLGKFAIHTTRKRLIGVQRQLKAEGKDYRAFEILNLGKYERQHYIGVNPNLREEEQQKQLEEKEAAFLDLILRAYRAEKTDGLRQLPRQEGRAAGGRRAGQPAGDAAVRRGDHPGMPQEAHHQGGHPGLRVRDGAVPQRAGRGAGQGHRHRAQVHPRRGVRQAGGGEEPGGLPRCVLSSRSSRIVEGRNSVAVELTDFSVFYSQDSIANAEAAIKDKGSRIVVEKGQIVKVSKDKDGIVTREVLTKNWTDWIDYWAVDFDFESKREIIRVKNEG